jgi:phosphoenolpyruvate-protein kinase (PTS system EI component)
VALAPDASNEICLEGAVICIESADPGYDWIFTRNIAGLVTRYGGTNSHMAIRCAEYGLPAAIGCGEQLFSQVCSAKSIVLDCGSKAISINFEEAFTNAMRLNEIALPKNLSAQR